MKHLYNKYLTKITFLIKTIILFLIFFRISFFFLFFYLFIFKICSCIWFNIWKINNICLFLFLFLFRQFFISYTFIINNYFTFRWLTIIFRRKTEMIFEWFLSLILPFIIIINTIIKINIKILKLNAIHGTNLINFFLFSLSLSSLNPKPFFSTLFKIFFNVS